MELDKNRDEYAWFVHPFNAAEWIYKKIDKPFVENLFEQDNINMGVLILGVDLATGNMSFEKKMNVSYNNLVLNINVPQEVGDSEAIFYNFACELSDNLFVMNQFNFDEKLFASSGSDDETIALKNQMVRRLQELKDSKINPNSYVEDDDYEDDEENDNV